MINITRQFIISLIIDKMDGWGIEGAVGARHECGAGKRDGVE